MKNYFIRHDKEFAIFSFSIVVCFKNTSRANVSFDFCVYSRQQAFKIQAEMHINKWDFLLP